MPRHLTNLNNTYQDMRDRYGLDDPIVAELKEELERREAAGDDLPLGERRLQKLNPQFWNRPARHYQSPAGRR